MLLPLDGLPDALERRIRGPVFANHQESDRTRLYSEVCPPDVFRAYEALSEGATDHMLLVDEEVGTILRVAARLDGREFRVAEVQEIAYDVESPEGTFRLESPGVEFRRLDIPDYDRP